MSANGAVFGAGGHLMAAMVGQSRNKTVFLDLKHQPALQMERASTSTMTSHNGGGGPDEWADALGPQALF